MTTALRERYPAVEAVVGQAGSATKGTAEPPGDGRAWLSLPSLRRR